MDTDRFRQRWKEARGTLRARWPELSEDDLDAIAGDFAALVSALERRYQWTSEQAAAEAETWVRELANGAGAGERKGEGVAFTDTAKATLGPGARKVREGLEVLGEGVRNLARVASDRARAKARESGEKISDKAHAAGDAAREKASDVNDHFHELLEQTENFVRERPFTSLGIAFAVCFLLSRRI
jgi:ElaB/YqjD/DUF883 family membrane-anchored ribosome-binding protein